MANLRRSIVRWAALGIALIAPALTFAQSCALCYTQAAGSGSRMIAALRSGILILAIPPTLICAGITWMAYKKRNQFNDYGDPHTTQGDEP
jgi:ABC-type Fe3+ transport system permease subunit